VRSLLYRLRLESALRTIGIQIGVEQVGSVRNVMSDRSDPAAHFRTHISVAECLKIFRGFALEHHSRPIYPFAFKLIPTLNFNERLSCYLYYNLVQNNQAVLTNIDLVRFRTAHFIFHVSIRYTPLPKTYRFKKIKHWQSLLFADYFSG
jgi:hypothetical protein